MKIGKKWTEKNLCTNNRLKKKKPLIIKRLSEAFAVWTGLEPATPCVTGRYSNQLNYQTSLMRMQIYTEWWIAQIYSW